MWRTQISQFQDLLENIRFQGSKNCEKLNLFFIEDALQFCLFHIQYSKFTSCVWNFLKFYTRDENVDTKLQFSSSPKIIHCTSQ